MNTTPAQLETPITADGPVSLEAMFEAGMSAIANPANAQEHGRRRPTAS
jgi:hypothetical protein